MKNRFFILIYRFFILILVVFMLFGCDNQKVVVVIPAQKVAKKEQIISKLYALKEGKMTLFFTDTTSKNYNPQNELLSEDNVLFYDYNKENTKENSKENTFKNIYITQKNDTSVQKNYLYYYLKDKIEIKQKIKEKEQIDRKSTRLNSSHSIASRMPSSA